MEGILKASYGDKQQRNVNQKPVDRKKSAAIETAWKERRASLGPRELPTPPRGQSSPFWDAKYHGNALGGHAPAPSHQIKTVKVEIRPGVYHTVEVVHGSPNPTSAQQAAAAAGPGQRSTQGPPVGSAPFRPASAPHSRPVKNTVSGSPAAVPPPRGSPQSARLRAAGASPQYIVPQGYDSLGQARAGMAPRGATAAAAASAPQRLPTARLPCEVDTLAMAPTIATVEERMRQALRGLAQVHVTERTVLLRAIGKVLHKKDIELGPRDTLSTHEFSVVWASLGVALTSDVIDALYNKYGHTNRGRLPVMMFAEVLLQGAPRQIMLENDWVQRGAYVAGQPATHTGKIQYPECKKGVWPPSDWDPRLAERSAQLPDIRLQLEFVYGYDGHVWKAERSAERDWERLFMHHDDDILCLAMHPDKTTVATGQVGKDPTVLIWDTNTLKVIQKLNMGYGNRGVQAACFSPSGTHLAVVCLDNPHTLYVWDWARRQVLMERKTMPGNPPSTYGVVWSPFETDRLLAYGQNFIKFYTVQRPDTQQGVGGGGNRGTDGLWECKQDAGVFSICKTFTVFGACFLPSGIVLTGNGAGSIGSWQGCRLVRETPAHAPGPLERRPDGIESPGGVRCLLLQSNNVLLTGGADGYVIKWDVSKGDLGPPLQRIPMLRPDQFGVVTPPAIRGLDCFPGSDVMVAGTSSCDVWEVDDTPRVLVHGQQGDLYGLAMNPTYPHVFATACESDTIMVWSAATRKPLRIIQMAQNGDMARSCAFSPDGEHLAVGMYSGGLKVMEFHPALAQIYWGKLFNESVDEIKYSPCGRYLAAGSHDQNLDVYDVKNGYKRVVRCHGHSSTITHLDWAADSSVIQSNDQAYEILYFDPRTGKQIKENQRDTNWDTWTCTLGFPVMGIWRPYSDGTDVNSCDRSPSGRYLLTADDEGKVNLLNYPCVVRHAPALRYGGHSSHVMNVRWSKDEKYAISVGGRDRCVFQWRVVEEVKAPDHFYGRQPIQPVDKGGLVYRMVDGVPAQQQRGSGAAAQHWASAPSPPGGVKPSVSRGGGPKAPLSGGGFGRR